MDKIKIIKAKILKGDKVEVDYQKTESDLSFTEINEKHNSAPHKDLTKAFAAIAVHAALLSEFISVNEIADIEEPEHPKLKDFTVSGFTVVGDEEEEGVIITGLKTLRSGKMMMFNTPLTRYNDASDNRYDYLDDLQKVVNLARKEVKRYLEGHRAPDPQLSLDLPEKQENPTRKKKSTTIKVLDPEQEVIDPRSADPEAMARVKAMDNEEQEEVEAPVIQMPKKKAAKKKASK